MSHRLSVEEPNFFESDLLSTIAVSIKRKGEGSKMAPPTRDIARRPKAKVGKRAPAKVNATDTSFKIASVAVSAQGQSLDKNAGGAKRPRRSADSGAATQTELASSRGNALSTLQQSLRHHAPAVRSSGLRGIRDAVHSLSSLETSLGVSTLEANLPSLLPNTCRCWLDEDDDVRSLAINLFGDVLNNLKSSFEHADLTCLAPFVPILCAYASSALNSLDRSVRKDGAVIVGMLASSDPFPSYSSLPFSSMKEGGISSMAVEMGKHVDGAFHVSLSLCTTSKIIPRDPQYCSRLLSIHSKLGKIVVIHFLWGSR